MGSSNITSLLQLFAALGSTDEREIEDAYYRLKDFLSKPGNSQYIVANEVYLFNCCILFPLSFCYPPSNISTLSFLFQSSLVSLLIHYEKVVPFLHVGLNHPDALIRALTIEQLSVCVGSVPNAIAFLVSTPQFSLISRCLLYLYL